MKVYLDAVTLAYHGEAWGFMPNTSNTNTIQSMDAAKEMLTSRFIALKIYIRLEVLKSIC